VVDAIYDFLARAGNCCRRPTSCALLGPAPVARNQQAQSHPRPVPGAGRFRRSAWCGTGSRTGGRPESRLPPANARTCPVFALAGVWSHSACPKTRALSPLVGVLRRAVHHVDDSPASGLFVTRLRVCPLAFEANEGQPTSGEIRGNAGRVTPFSSLDHEAVIAHSGTRPAGLI